MAIDLTDLPWGTHICWFYDTAQDLVETLVPYFKAGLERGASCVWVTSDPLGPDEARLALRDAMPGVDRQAAEGRLEIIPGSDWYLHNGTFDPDQVLRRCHQKLDEALARGHAGMRFNGNASWHGGKYRAEFAEYERKLHSAITGQPMIVLCSYPLRSSGAAELLDTVRNHQFAVARRHQSWEIVEASELKRAEEERRYRGLADRSSAQLRALSARVESAREEEGTRIARELHDELGGALTGMRWDLTAIGAAGTGDAAGLQEALAGIIRSVDAIIDTVRRLASDLRPPILDELGLTAAVEWQAQQFAARTGIECHVDALLREEHEPDQDQATTLFRILQEALTNIQRHAQATRVNVLLDERDGMFVLEIRDNGQGISRETADASTSLGLMGMQERAHLLGGRVDIAGAEGQGTAVTAHIPVRRGLPPES